VRFHLSSLAKNLLAGLRLALFLPVRASDYRVSGLDFVLLALFGCVAWVAVAAVLAGFEGEFNPSAIPIYLASISLVLGTALLVTSPAGALDPSARFLGGVFLAFVAGLAYALYVLAAKATLRRSAPLPTTALTFTIGALLLTPALWWTTAPLTQLALGWPWLVYLGGVATAGAYAIYTVGLRRVPASVAGVTTLLEPLTATILGVALFGERLGPAGGVGALLLVVALGLLLADRGPS